MVSIQLQTDLEQFRQDLEKIVGLDTSNTSFLSGNNFYVYSDFPSFKVKLAAYTDQGFAIKCQVISDGVVHTIPKSLYNKEDVYKEVELFLEES
jgi:hypothetical protein